MFPADPPDCRHAVRSGLYQLADILRVHSADGDDWNHYRSDHRSYEINSRGRPPCVTRRFEDRSGDAPRSSGLFGFDCFVQTVNAGANRYFGSDGHRLRNPEGVRCQLNSARSNSTGDIHPVIHYEPAAGPLLNFDKLRCDVVKLSSRCPGASKVNGTSGAECFHHAGGSLDEPRLQNRCAIRYCMDDGKRRSKQPHAHLSPTATPRPRAHCAEVIRVFPEG